jgi:hypothetical protein
MADNPDDPITPFDEIDFGAAPTTGAFGISDAKYDAFKHGKPLNAKPGEQPTDKRERYHRFRATALWQRIRAAQMAKMPICEIRVKCQGAVATCVDHRIPAWLLPEAFWINTDNHQSACNECNVWKEHDDRKRVRELRPLAAEYIRLHSGSTPGMTGPITF